MSDSCKVVAYYLPQYHSIPENDMWWGKGFTEWTNVKKAIPFYDGQIQPRIPLDNNYYNLLDKDTVKWQTDLSQKYGLYGFCYFHYYFGDGKHLLEKPAENLLRWKDVNQRFCFFWANSSWARTWNANEHNETTWAPDDGSASGKKVLVEQKYNGEKDWKDHIDYLIPYFQDDRYIKIDNRPFFAIYMADEVPNLDEMVSFWNKELRKNGIDGVYIASVNKSIPKCKNIDAILQYGYGTYSKTPRYYANRIFSKILSTVNYKYTEKVWDYEAVWKMITEKKPDANIHTIPGGTVQYDETPRRGDSALVFKNSSPEIFEKYMKIQLKRAKEVYHSDYLFLDAWNEWGEGNYLEPDLTWGYQYLDALQKSMN